MRVIEGKFRYLVSGWSLCIGTEMATSSPEGMDVDRILDCKRFRALFSDRAVVLTGLAQEMLRDLAARVSESVGRGEAMLRALAEYDGLFDAAARGAGPTTEFR